MTDSTNPLSRITHETQLRIAFVLTILSTVAAFAVTVPLVSSGYAAEANPITAGLIATIGWTGSGLLALGATVLAFAAIERLPAPWYHRTGWAIAAASLADAVWSGYVFEAHGVEWASLPGQQALLVVGSVGLTTILVLWHSEIQDALSRMKGLKQVQKRQVIALGLVSLMLLSATAPAVALSAGTSSTSSELNTSVATSVDDWKDYYYALGSGNTIEKVHPNGTTVATFDGVGSTSLEIADGYIYHGDSAGTIYKIDPTDMTAESTTTIPHNIQTFAYNDGKYIYGSDNSGNLYKINKNDLSTAATGSSSANGEGVVIKNGYLILGDDNGNVMSYNTADLTKINEVTGGNADQIFPLLAGPDNIYAGTSDAGSGNGQINKMSINSSGYLTHETSNVLTDSGFVSLEYNPETGTFAGGDTGGEFVKFDSSLSQLADLDPLLNGDNIDDLETDPNGGTVYFGDRGGNVGAIDMESVSLNNSASTGQSFIFDLAAVSPGSPSLQKTVSGQVTDQYGNPVANATVRVTGVDHTKITSGAAQTLRDRAEELIKQSKNPKPPSWDASVEPTNLPEKTLDTDAEPASKFVAGYTASDVINQEVGNPKLRFEPGQEIYLGVWDAARDCGLGGLAPCDNYDRDLQGILVDNTDVVIESLGPDGSVTQRQTSTTYEVRDLSGGAISQLNSEHEFANVSLPSGFYRVHPEGKPQTSYVIAVAPNRDVSQLASLIESDLNATAGNLTQRAQDIQDKLNSGKFVTKTTTTNATGYYSVDVGANVKTVNVEAFKGGETAQLYEKVQAGQSPPSALRDAYNNEGYNGSVLLPQSQIYSAPNQNADITLFERPTISGTNISKYGDLQQFLDDYFANNSENFQGLPYEVNNLQDFLKHRNKLLGMVKSNNQSTQVFAENYPQWSGTNNETITISEVGPNVSDSRVTRENVQKWTKQTGALAWALRNSPKNLDPGDTSYKISNRTETLTKQFEIGRVIGGKDELDVYAVYADGTRDTIGDDGYDLSVQTLSSTTVVTVESYQVLEDKDLMTIALDFQQTEITNVNRTIDEGTRVVTTRIQTFQDLTKNQTNVFAHYASGNQTKLNDTEWEIIETSDGDDVLVENWSVPSGETMQRLQLETGTVEVGNTTVNFSGGQSGSWLNTTFATPVQLSKSNTTVFAYNSTGYRYTIPDTDWSIINESDGDDLQINWSIPSGETIENVTTDHPQFVDNDTRFDVNDTTDVSTGTDGDSLLNATVDTPIKDLNKSTVDVVVEFSDGSQTTLNDSAWSVVDALEGDKVKVTDWPVPEGKDPTFVSVKYGSYQDANGSLSEQNYLDATIEFGDGDRFDLGEDFSAEDVELIAHLQGGESKTIPPEYWSVNQNRVTNDAIEIDSYPLPQGSSVTRVEVLAVNEQGVGRVEFPVTQTGNIAGEIPNLEAIDASTLTPGPDETVTLQLRPEQRSVFANVTSAEVTLPNGTTVAATVADSAVVFDTAGEGAHTVTVRYQNTQGERFTQVVDITAADQPLDAPATIRAKSSASGLYALAGDKFESGTIAESGGRLLVAAQLPQSADPPTSMHVHTETVSGDAEGVIEMSVVKGTSKEAVNTQIGVTLHTSSIPDGALVYREQTQPINDNEFGTWNSSATGATIQTYTQADGTVSVRVIPNPTRLQEVFWVVRNIDIPFYGRPLVGMVAFPMPGGIGLSLFGLFPFGFVAVSGLVRTRGGDPDE